MDRTSLIAIAVCFVAFIGWEQYLNDKYPDRYKVQEEQAIDGSAPKRSHKEAYSEESKKTAPNEAEEKEQESFVQLDQSQLRIETNTSIYTFDQETGGVSSIKLKKYKNDAYEDMMEIAQEGFLLQPHLSDRKIKGSRGFYGEREGGRLTFKRHEASWELKHSIEPDPDNYGAVIDFTWTNTSTKAQELESSVLFAETMNYAVDKSGFLPGMPTGRPSILSSVNSESSWQDVKDYCSEPLKSADMVQGRNQELDFIGFDRHYFFKAILPQSKKSSFSVFSSERVADTSCLISQFISLSQGLVEPGQSVSLSYKAWFGPKDTELLSSYDQKLENTLDLGFFSKICKPLLWSLRYVHSLVDNWGVAIIICALLLKILLFPLAKQASIAQAKMKKLQPEMDRIKKKYKDDPAAQQREMMRFMASNKVNPMKGCIPMLPQIPIGFGFFRVLSTSLELRHAPFVGWITDLSVKDPYYITPLILGIFMVIQQRMTPMAGADKAQQRIMLMMPVMFTVLMITMPAGLALYILVNTVLSIGQQYWLNKQYA